MYTLRPSTRKHKKYMAVWRDGRPAVHFGDNRYEHWRDSTPLGIYTHLNHNDDERRRRYYLRHGYNAKLHSAKWFAHKYLW